MDDDNRKLPAVFRYILHFFKLQFHVDGFY